MMKHDSSRFRSGAAPLALFTAVLAMRIVGGRACRQRLHRQRLDSTRERQDPHDGPAESRGVLGADRERRIRGSRRSGSGHRAASWVINLNGRTVVPGLIDNHNHIILLGLRPGHDVRLDKARSIAKAQELLAAKAATVQPGEWVVTLGGIHRNQFVAPPAAARFPNLAELDAALPANPTLLFEGFSGPSQTNSIGRAFFQSKGIAVACGRLDRGKCPLPPGAAGAARSAAAQQPAGANEGSVGRARDSGSPSG